MNNFFFNIKKFIQEKIFNEIIISNSFVISNLRLII